MRKKIFLFLCLVISQLGYSQYWEGIGRINGEIRTFFEDTIDDKLYIGGTFGLFNEDTTISIISWDGISGSRVGCGINWDCNSYVNPNGGPPVYGIIRFKNCIYVTGAFSSVSGIGVNSIACWNNSEWSAIGTGLTDIGGGRGLGLGFKIINDELYVFGSFDSCAGIAANSIAKFDGETWTSVNNIPRFRQSDPNSISDVELYRNELYIGGNFYDEYDSTGDKTRIVRFSEGEWKAVGHGIRGGFAGIDKMLVFENELYVAGMIDTRQSPLNPGNGIVKWNGAEWSSVGGDLKALSISHIFDMQIFKSKLYICGGFNNAGGIPARDIAYWDGENWCSMCLPGACPTPILELGTFRDTLYIGGGFRHVNGDSNISRIAKWIGGDYVEACGNATGNPPHPEKEELMVYPNPSSDRFTIILPNGFIGECNVYNATGQLIDRMQNITNNSFEINLEGYSKGLYFMQLIEEKTGKTKALKLILK